MEVQQIKQRFGIIGNAGALNRAIDIAAQVAPTDLSVLVTGESGTGKEVMPKIIHQLSARKHAKLIAVNCGAIPEGTIDSELFGHEKGAFTGATAAREGYFQVADGGTIFLDEVAELPLQTQVRLLRVLETGEFIRVGSSKVQKTNVRIVAATNVNIPEAVKKGKFREDLYYRLNTVPITIPALRERKEDIHLLFRKFAADFSEKYRMPAITLTEDAVQLLENYSWPGNIRQLKNVTEQIAVIEQDRNINGEALMNYLPKSASSSLPVLYEGEGSTQGGDFSERDILYKVLFDLKNDVMDLKKVVFGLMGEQGVNDEESKQTMRRLLETEQRTQDAGDVVRIVRSDEEEIEHVQAPDIVIESLSIADKEKELIQKALEKHQGKRKHAARELGISERTLYRKIKEYNLAAL